MPARELFERGVRNMPAPAPVAPPKPAPQQPRPQQPRPNKPRPDPFRPGKIDPSERPNVRPKAIMPMGESRAATVVKQLLEEE